ncbi:MAG: CHASE2 domain-containing protein [Leptolyngbya sp. SIO3F4]|nr:CHASE2 domain-containing protein [Leptolyngbya sp. SIO3F4]
MVSGIVISFSSLGAFNHLENLSADLLTRWRGSRPWHEDLMVIGIDDTTSDELGILPLSRDYYADLLQTLNEADAGIVTFDILMRGESSEDLELSRAMQRYKNNGVVLADATNSGRRLLKPPQVLLDSAISNGYINAQADNDGVTRRHILSFTQNDHSLAVATAKAYSLTTDLIALPPEQEIYINWPNKVEEIAYANFVDVISGKIPADRLRDKVIFVGSTATGEDQNVRTPFNNDDPTWGVYVFAAVMDNLLHKSWLRVLDTRLTLLVILVAGPLMSWGLKGRSFLVQVALWAGSVSLWVLLCLGVRYQNILLPMATPIVLFSLTEGLIVFTDRLRSNALLQARNEFLGTMSHELRTPLNAIIGVSEMMQETHLDPRQREFSETIQNSSQGLLALINDVLDFSKIEAGKLILEEHSVNLRHAVEESLDIVSTRAANKPVELVYMVDPKTPPLIIGDPVRLRQILLNLLSNAVKFTAKGEVAVIVQPSPSDDLGIPVTRWKNPAEESVLLLFAVQDTGIGIPEDRITQIFEPFRQASVSTTRKYGGTGLGLTISKRLAETMGGRLWVESELNRGSTFFFTIRAQVDPVAVQPEPPAALAGWANQRLLIIDQNTTRRKNLYWQLEILDINVVFCRNVAEALLLIQHGQQFDGVILDAAITKIDSMSAIDSLRQAMDTSKVPIIVLSDVKENLSHDEQSGMAIVWKPIKQSALYRALINVHPRAVVISTDTVSDKVNDVETTTVSLKVLVADDNPVNQRVAQHMLQLLGHKADTVSTGDAALLAVQQDKYDVVLMDMRMPQMSGVEATRRIRQLGQQISQPWIIAMTANASSEDRDHCLKAGMNDYISKPIRRDILSHMFENIENTSNSLTA